MDNKLDQAQSDFIRKMQKEKWTAEQLAIMGYMMDVWKLYPDKPFFRMMDATCKCAEILWPHDDPKELSNEKTIKMLEYIANNINEDPYV